MATSPQYNRTADHGPFDIIGDVHGCARELDELFQKLGYRLRTIGDKDVYAHPSGRRAIFVGDLVDRGPHILKVVTDVMHMVRTGNALCVKGNHEAALAIQLRQNAALPSRTLLASLEQLGALPPKERETFQREFLEFVDDLPFHYVLDDGKLVVAHAGLPSVYQGTDDEASRDFAMYGVKARADESITKYVPSRAAWVLDYSGDASVVYGHTPVDTPRWINNTLCIDTGCVYGGALTAFRYPERETVSVRAYETYFDGNDKIWYAPEER